MKNPSQAIGGAVRSRAALAALLDFHPRSAAGGRSYDDSTILLMRGRLYETRVEVTRQEGQGETRESRPGLAEKIPRTRYRADDTATRRTRVESGSAGDLDHRMAEAPGAGGQEAVVEALIGGEGRGLPRELRSVPERLQSQRPRPEEHLEDEEPDVLDHHEEHDGAQGSLHGTAGRQ